MEQRILSMQIIEEFRRYLMTEEKSAATVKKYLRDIRKFAGGTNAITRETVLTYKRRLQENYAARSVNSIVASLNRLFAYCGWHELRVKTIKLQRRAFCTEERELTREEYVRLCCAAKKRENERLSMLLQTICGTGIRVSELQAITVEAARRGEAVVACKGKTRVVLIVRKLQQNLLRYAAKQGIQSGMIFVTRSGKPMNRTNIWREMKQLCAAAEVDPRKVFPHNLRHLFAREFYRADKDIAKLADILGHSSIDTTRIYIISTGAEHHRQMERLHLIL